jgi:hypothetical protein
MHTLLAASLLLSAASALAHDSRPAYTWSSSRQTQPSSN